MSRLTETELYNNVSERIKFLSLTLLVSILLVPTLKSVDVKLVVSDINQTLTFPFIVGIVKIIININP